MHALFSNQLWGMFKLSSKNPNHQMIHWKWTPPKCNLCSQGVLGKYLHFFFGGGGGGGVLPLSLTRISQDLSYVSGTEIYLTPAHFVHV